MYTPKTTVQNLSLAVSAIGKTTLITYHIPASYSL